MLSKLLRTVPKSRGSISSLKVPQYLKDTEFRRNLYLFVSLPFSFFRILFWSSRSSKLNHHGFSKKNIAISFFQRFSGCFSFGSPTKACPFMRPSFIKRISNMIRCVSEEKSTYLPNINLRSFS